MSWDDLDPYSGPMRPVGNVGELLCLLSSNGFYVPQGGAAGSSPFYEIDSVEPLPLIGQHGATLIWTQANAAPNAYALDSAAISGTIGTGVQVSVTPASFTPGNNQLLQMRWMPAVGGTLPVGWAVDDMDVTVAQPAAVTRWAMGGTQAVANAMGFFPLPSAITGLPAQGANYAPAIYPLDQWSDHAAKSTLFAYQSQQAPKFFIKNNSTALAMSTTMFVAIVATGYVFNLRQLLPGSGWVRDRLLGQDMPRPVDYAGVPRPYRYVQTAARAALTAP